ncbi:hypothetical protein DICPUDRAFT_28723, partial [Dictyostelium purpureum]
EGARKSPDSKCLDGKEIVSKSLLLRPIPPLRPNYCDSLDRQQFAYRFLERFFNVYDANRENIIKVYTNESKFSMTYLADSESLPIKGSERVYQKSNRNLMKQMGNNKKTKILYSGNDKIYKFFKLCPKTQHTLSSFIIDTFLVPGTKLLSVIVHGHFLEPKYNLMRSFDRTFILAQAPPGSDAAGNGWEAIILNDNLNVRPYKLLPKVHIVESEPSDAEKEEITNEFSAYTKLKPEFAYECLLMAGWDQMMAFFSFSNLRDNYQIPQEYFIQ